MRCATLHLMAQNPVVLMRALTRHALIVQIEWWEGLLLMVGYIVYVIFMSQNTKVARALARHGRKKSISGQLARRLSSSYLAADIAKMNLPDPNFCKADGVAVTIECDDGSSDEVRMLALPQRGCTPYLARNRYLASHGVHARSSHVARPMHAC